MSHYQLWISPQRSYFYVCFVYIAFIFSLGSNHTALEISQHALLINWDKFDLITKNMPEFCQRLTTPSATYLSLPVADADLELRRGGGGGGVLDFLALLAFSLQTRFLFLPKIREGGGGSSRPATVYEDKNVSTETNLQRSRSPATNRDIFGNTNKISFPWDKVVHHFQKALKKRVKYSVCIALFRCD